MKRTIRLTENKLCDYIIECIMNQNSAYVSRNKRLERLIDESVKKVLNEISPEMKARAMVKANHDLQRLDLSNNDVETNLNGDSVHKDTQKRRRDRQIMAFKKGLESDLTRRFNKDVRFGIDSSKLDDTDTKFNKDDDTHYVNTFSSDYDDGKFRHFSKSDATYDGTRFYPRNNSNVSQRDMRAADYLTNMVDAMSGYDSELKGHYPYNTAIKYANNRADDVEKIRKYRQDMEDYENRRMQHDLQTREYDSLPWYRKPFNKKPSEFRELKPKYPDIQTGPYFMPDKPEHMYNWAEDVKAKHRAHMDAYNNHLRKKS